MNLGVLNPLICLENKLKSLVGLPQKDRQNLKHLKISIPIVRFYLSSISNNLKPTTALKFIEKVWNLTMTDDDLQHQI